MWQILLARAWSWPNISQVMLPNAIDWTDWLSVVSWLCQLLKGVSLHLERFSCVHYPGPNGPWDKGNEYMQTPPSKQHKPDPPPQNHMHPHPYPRTLAPKPRPEHLCQCWPPGNLSFGLAGFRPVIPVTLCAGKLLPASHGHLLSFEHPHGERQAWECTGTSCQPLTLHRQRIVWKSTSLGSCGTITVI